MTDETERTPTQAEVAAWDYVWMLTERADERTKSLYNDLYESCERGDGVSRDKMDELNQEIGRYDALLDVLAVLPGHPSTRENEDNNEVSDE